MIRKFEILSLILLLEEMSCVEDWFYPIGMRRGTSTKRSAFFFSCEATRGSDGIGFLLHFTLFNNITVSLLPKTL